MASKNILLITSDQQHWFTLGVQNPEIKTPNLDRLAARGTLFTRAYTPNPTCTPTRASIITGKYPSQHGAWSLGTKLPESENTIGDEFRRGGYKATLIGKAHFQPLTTTEEFPSLEAYPVLQDLDFWRDFDEPFYGFDHVGAARNHTDEAHVGQHYALWLEEKGCENWRDYFRTPTGNNDSQKRTWEIPEEYHYNTWIAERSNAMLEEYADSGENFFLWSSYFDPHPSYLVPSPWDKMYDPESLTIKQYTDGEFDDMPPHFGLTQEKRPDFKPYRTDEGKQWSAWISLHLHAREELAKDVAIYYGMISMMDHYIGKILDKLDDLGLTENTLVVFTTDHGHFFGQHGLIAKGAFHYEDMLRVPLIASMPGSIAQGAQDTSMQSLVDLAPTFLSFAGLDIPRDMTGLDQKDAWLGKEPAIRDHVIVENHHNPTTVHLKTYIEKQYKITVYYNQSYGELFDLENDPEELVNLWDDPQNAEIKSSLLLKFLHAEMGKEPMWMPRIAGA